jgi:hypothetical protein
MTKPVSLARLRDISKQRSIRRPLLMPVPADYGDEPGDVPATKVEWPIPIKA